MRSQSHHLATNRVSTASPLGLQARFETVVEDTPTVLQLATRDDAGNRRGCLILTQPSTGSLYQLGFLPARPNSPPIESYEFLETDVSKLEPITTFPALVTAERCALLTSPLPC